MRLLWFCLVLISINPIRGFFIPPKKVPTSTAIKVASAMAAPEYQPRPTHPIYYDYPPIKSFLLKRIIDKIQNLEVGRLPLNPAPMFRF